MNRYEQSTGRFYDGKGNLLGCGAAGQQVGYNNPEAESIKDIGPLPRGFYKIGPSYHHPHLGPVTMNLTPFPENEMHGRGDFRIHGFSADHPELSSHGCICQHLSTRQAIDQLRSTDDVVEVVR